MSFLKFLIVSSFLLTFGNYWSDARRSRELPEYNPQISDQNIDTELNGEIENFMHVQYDSKSNGIGDKETKTKRSHLQKKNISAPQRKSNPNSPHIIEVLVVLDESFRKFHNDIGNNMNEYVSRLMSIAANVFANPSIGNLINIAVIGIDDLTEDLDVEDLYEGKSAVGMLKKFGNYMHKQTKKSRYDVALLLTRENICLVGEGCTNIIGLANRGEICSELSYALVEDTGLYSGYTIAHEFGHLLNASHDDESLCKNDKHIMAAIPSSESKIWSWSSCSKNFITNFLKDKNRSSCLLETEASITISKSNSSSISQDYQCRLAYGNSSKAKKLPGNPCNIMICQTLINFVMPWADGTACNAGKLPRSTCYQGVCYGPKELDEIKRDLLCMRKQLKADGKDMDAACSPNSSDKCVDGTCRPVGPDESDISNADTHQRHQELLILLTSVLMTILIYLNQ